MVREEQMMRRVSLYWHTARHLRPVQVGARLWRFVYQPTVVRLPAQPVRRVAGRWVLPARRTLSMVGPMTFSFLNERRSVQGSAWGADAPSQLWCYNIHYFDDLNAFNASARRAWHVEAVDRWIADNPPGPGDAWAPYPTSLRIVNWIKWALGGAQLPQAALASLATQAGMLSRRIEYHLLGNHLLANAKALVFSGLFFDGSEAERWLKKGMRLLARAIPEQILPDGGHFERSTMYHALALDDLLDLINVANAFSANIPQRWNALVASWRPLALRMRTWLSAMCHPDGEISFFNDAAIGIAPSSVELDRYATELLYAAGAITSSKGSHDVRLRSSLRTTHLADSGYVRSEAADTVLLTDVAPVGPDYLPGHAHADTLSFELSLFGQRVVVNGGTSQYGLGHERESERGTPAHSTVTINGQNSSEVWGGFRVARRARPFDLAVTDEAQCARISCAHDGYRRLAGRPVHRRTWLLRPGALRIEDTIEGSFRTAIARFHLHPAVRCVPDGGASGADLRLPDGQTVRLLASGGGVQLEDSRYCPQFGRREPSQCLALAFPEHGKVCMDITW